MPVSHIMVGRVRADYKLRADGSLDIDLLAPEITPAAIESLRELRGARGGGDSIRFQALAMDVANELVSNKSALGPNAQFVGLVAFAHTPTLLTRFGHLILAAAKAQRAIPRNNGTGKPPRRLPVRKPLFHGKSFEVIRESREDPFGDS